jgi:hypothetical protein
MPAISKNTATSKRPRRRRKPAASVSVAVDHRAILARRLDLWANCELQHGHHGAAEHLARRAEALREVAQ